MENLTRVLECNLGLILPKCAFLFVCVCVYPQHAHAHGPESWPARLYALTLVCMRPAAVGGTREGREGCVDGMRRQGGRCLVQAQEF